eukprot:g29027.t1
MGGDDEQQAETECLANQYVTVIMTMVQLYQSTVAIASSTVSKKDKTEYSGYYESSESVTKFLCGSTNITNDTINTNTLFSKTTTMLAALGDWFALSPAYRPTFVSPNPRFRPCGPNIAGTCSRQYQAPK